MVERVETVFLPHGRAIQSHSNRGELGHEFKVTEIGIIVIVVFNNNMHHRPSKQLLALHAFLGAQLLQRCLKNGRQRRGRVNIEAKHIYLSQSIGKLEKLIPRMKGNQFFQYTRRSIVIEVVAAR